MVSTLDEGTKTLNEERILTSSFLKDASEKIVPCSDSKSYCEDSIFWISLCKLRVRVISPFVITGSIFFMELFHQKFCVFFLKLLASKPVNDGLPKPSAEARFF